MIEVSKVKQMGLLALGNFVQQVVAVGDTKVLSVIGGDKSAYHMLHTGVDNDLGNIVNGSFLVDDNRSRIHEF